MKKSLLSDRPASAPSGAKTRSITGRTQAWLSEYSTIGAEDMRGNPQHVIHNLSFMQIDRKSPGREGYAPRGFTYVGEATVTVQAVDDDTLLANKVESLRVELKSVHAEATKKATEIESKIQKLLAIGFDGEVL